MTSPAWPYEYMPCRRVVLLLTVLTGCRALPQRLPLPAPFMPIHGATPMPGRGVGVSMEQGRGVLGPELVSADMRATQFGFGVGDRLSFWTGSPQTRGSRENLAGAAGYAGVSQFRGKLRLAKPFGRRAVLSVYGGHAWGGRFVLGEPQYDFSSAAPTVMTRDTLQRDRVWSWDAALPLEILLSSRFEETVASAFLGPRIVHMKYEDRLTPDGNFSMTFPGAVGGLHISVFHYEFFLEGTLARVPFHSYQGRGVGGRWAFMPAFGAVMRIGPPFRW